MRRLLSVALAFVTGAGVLLALAGPAAAAPWAPKPPPKTWLTLTIGAPTTPGPSDRTEPIVVKLWCDPPRGSHPHAAEACAEWHAAGGDVSAVSSGSAGCGGVWQPVEITAAGRYQGEPVSYSAVASNDGCARIMHGHIFRF